MKHYLINFLIVFISISSLAQNYGDYVEILSSSPDFNSIKDLKKIDKFFVSRYIVGIGESTHGTSEFNTMRHRMIKYLVQEKNFNTIFLEADPGACDLINDYINDRYEDLNGALNQLILWPWQTKEMANLINWVKNYNLENKSNHISIIGIDMQLPLIDMQVLNKRINNKKINDSLNFFLNEGIYKNKGHLISYLKSISHENSDIKTSALTNSIIQNLSLNKKNNYIKLTNFRDSCMAENILSYKNNYSTMKGILIAHNGHVMKKNERIDKFHNKKTLGLFLFEKINDKYFSIGQDFGFGAFNAIALKKDNRDVEVFNIDEIKKGTLIEYLLKFEKNIIFIPTQFIPEEFNLMNHIGSSYAKKNKLSDDAKYFDAIIFFKNAKESKLINFKNN